MVGMSDLLLVTLGLLVSIARCCANPIAPETFGLVKAQRRLPEPNPKSSRPPFGDESLASGRAFEPDWASATI
jgi:hypothetical protein